MAPNDTNPAASTPNIYQRMQQIMRSVGRLYKAGWNKHHQFQFLSHDDVTAALREHYVNTGIVRTVTVLDTIRIDSSHGTVAVVKLRVRWINVDAPSDFFDAEITTESQPGGKGGPTPQQIGSAVSYGVKMLEIKNFALVGDNEPDTDGLAKQAEPVSQGVAPVAEVPGLSPFDYYMGGFYNVQNAEQLASLMNEVAGKRSQFTPDEIKALSTAYRDTVTKLGGEQ